MLKPNIMANILSAVLIYISEHVFNLNTVYTRWRSVICICAKSMLSITLLYLAANSKTFFIIFFK